MQKEEIVKLFEDAGAIQHGHFVLTSGRHAQTYIQCQRVMENPDLTFKLAQEAISRLPQSLIDSIDVVVSPAVGGITWGFAVALALKKRFIFAERVDGKMTFRRSFELNDDEKALICEDVVTTGGSVKEVCDLVEANGAKALAVVSMIDRKSGRAFDQDFYPLLEFETKSWSADECELCAEGVDFVSPGSRRINH